MLFRGGVDVATLPKEKAQDVMNKWVAWMGQLRRSGHFDRGHPLDDGGKVLSGKGGKGVKSFVERKDSVGGYLIIKAGNLAEATKLAQGCPIFNNGGTVEVRPMMEM